MRYLLSLFFFLFFLGASWTSASTIPQEKINENIDFLEMYSRYKEIYDVHQMQSGAQRAIDGLENINFSMVPYVAPIKGFDSIKTHYAYPLKVFLPATATVTAARLSNSEVQPEFSQNIITVTTAREFESGVLDVVFILGQELNKGQFLSVKLDRYLPALDVLDSEPLYTQARYYLPQVLQNHEVIAKLNASERERELNRIQYQGVFYEVWLVSKTKNGKILERNKDDQYINASVVHNGVQYNYQIQTGSER